jgi:hypothetical protein
VRLLSTLLGYIVPSYADAAHLPGGSSNTTDPAPSLGTFAARTDVGQVLAWHPGSGRWLNVMGGVQIDVIQFTSAVTINQSASSWTDILTIPIPLQIPWKFVLDVPLQINQGSAAGGTSGVPIDWQWRLVDSAATATSYTTYYAGGGGRLPSFSTTSGGSAIFTHHEDRPQLAQAAGANNAGKLQMILTTTGTTGSIFTLSGNATTAGTMKTVTV